MSQQMIDMAGAAPAGAAPKAACQRSRKVVMGPRAARRRAERAQADRLQEVEDGKREHDKTRLPQCPNKKPYHTKCTHGHNNIIAAPCKRRDCQACHDAWRYNFRWTVRHGVALIRADHHIRPDLPPDHPDQAGFMFGTFTIPDIPGVHETQEQLTDRLMAAWKRLEQNYLRRHHPGHHTIRVLEFGGENGRPHLHLITDAPIPYAEDVSTTTEGGEKITMTKAEWEARLSPEAKAFQEALYSAGFRGGKTRPIYSADRVRTAGSAADYMSKYVSKDAKSIQRADGKRLRLTGHTRNWPTPDALSIYQHGSTRPAPETAELKPCPQCSEAIGAASTIRTVTIRQRNSMFNNPQYDIEDNRLHRATIHHVMGIKPSPPHPTTEALITTMSRAGHRALRRVNAETWLLGFDTHDNFIRRVRQLDDLTKQLAKAHAGRGAYDRCRDRAARYHKKAAGLAPRVNAALEALAVAISDAESIRELTEQRKEARAANRRAKRHNDAAAAEQARAETAALTAQIHPLRSAKRRAEGCAKRLVLRFNKYLDTSRAADIDAATIRARARNRAAAKQTILDEYADVRTCRRNRQTIIDRLREAGYEGPLRLLSDWARADYDLDKMLRAVA